MMYGEGRSLTPIGPARNPRTIQRCVIDGVDPIGSRVFDLVSLSVCTIEPTFLLRRRYYVDRFPSSSYFLVLAPSAWAVPPVEAVNQSKC